MHHPQTPEAQQAALALYQRRAERYDLELAAFDALRQEAIAALHLQPGETVLDLGCGTGLSLPALQAAVGPGGHVLGVEQCPAMLAQAEARVRAGHWCHVRLQGCAVAQARLPRRADAALFFFTHDIQQQEAALARVCAHLRPGARVVAVGLCWAPPWLGLANLFVLGAALYSIRAPDYLASLSQPWRLLAARLASHRVEKRWLDSIYLLRGCI
ncbi:class I SAM-dependent methyltransferase [Paucibacter soli]|uniref:class I SAM-dependent methyltransferase n=1 Tax=Paucibacter soli TaxID=3133433 RepID=UPI0030A86169